MEYQLMQSVLSQLLVKMLVGWIANKMVRNENISVEKIQSSFFFIGITPSLIQTGTHETLTVYYVKANFTTIITRDVSIFEL